jgi:hypothetical protein
VIPGYGSQFKESGGAPPLANTNNQHLVTRPSVSAESSVLLVNSGPEFGREITHVNPPAGASAEKRACGHSTSRAATDLEYATNFAATVLDEAGGLLCLSRCAYFKGSNQMPNPANALAPEE